MSSNSITHCIWGPIESIETKSLSAHLGTKVCALFDIRLCRSVQRLHSSWDRCYEENFKQWLRDWQSMLHLKIGAKRTVFLFPFPAWKFLLFATNTVFSLICIWSVTCSHAFNLSFKHTYCLFQNFYPNENMSSWQVLNWKSLSMEVTWVLEFLKLWLCSKGLSLSTRSGESVFNLQFLAMAWGNL